MSGQLYCTSSDCCATAEVRIYVNAELQLHGSGYLGGCFGVSITHALSEGDVVAHTTRSLFASGFTKYV